MPREQLLGLASDVERLLAAGATAAAGSDKLRQRARTLRELGAQVPALIPVADAVDRVLQAPPKQAGAAFLDLVLRARQVRGSIAGSGLAGDLEPIPDSGPWKSPLPTNDAQALHQVLHGGGAGREETLKEAIEKKSTGDLRMLTGLLKAIEDNNASFADLVATKALPALGKAALPDLTAKLNLQGKVGDARRLSCICLIDKGRGAELCRKAVAEGSVPLKVQALELLPDVVPATEAEKIGLQLIEDKSAEVRAAAISALRTAASQEAFEKLWEKTKDRSDSVGRAAFASLGTVKYKDASPRLLAELKQNFETLPVVPKAKKEPKGKAAKGKAAKGKAAAAAPAKPAPKGKKEETPVQIAQRRNKQMQVIRSLAGSLGHRNFDPHRKAVAEALIDLAGCKDEDLRWAAVRALGTLGPANDQVLPTLMRLIDDKKNQVVYLAVCALSEMDPAGRDTAIPAVLKRLGQPKLEPRTYRQGIRMLPEHMKNHGKAILALLKERLAHRDRWTANLAAEVAGGLGPQARPILDGILNLVRKPGYSYGTASFSRLTEIDPEGKDVLPAAAEMLKDKNHYVRHRALTIFAAYGAASKPYREAISLMATKDKQSWVQNYAETTLRTIDAS
jgi:HEAT repeat protein